MANVYNGQVVGLATCSGTTTPGTVTAFCRKVSSGSLSRNPNNVVNKGIGGQVQLRKGADEVTLEWTCVGPTAANVAKWFPTTAGVQVASFPNFFIEVDDGTNGQEMILSGGQPASCTITASENGQFEYQFSAKFTTAAEVARGTSAATYNTYIGHTIGDAVVAYGGTPYGTRSLSISNDLGTEMVNTMDTATAGARTVPTAYVVTTQNVRYSAVVTDEYLMDGMDGDTWTPIDITVTLTNGVTAENITYTLDDFVPDSFALPLEAEGVIGFGVEYVPGSGTIYNRVVLT